MGTQSESKNLCKRHDVPMIGRQSSLSFKICLSVAVIPFTSEVC